MADLTLNQILRLEDALGGLGRESLERLDSEFEVDQVSKPGVTCPVTLQSIVTSCQLSNCIYYIDHIWSRNCLLEFIDGQTKDSLSVEEISVTCGKSKSTVESIIQNSISAMQKNTERCTGIKASPQKDPVFPKVSYSDEDPPLPKEAVCPSSLGSVNEKMESWAPVKEVLSHPAARYLGVMGSIIEDL